MRQIWQGGVADEQGAAPVQRQPVGHQHHFCSRDPLGTPAELDPVHAGAGPAGIGDGEDTRLTPSTTRYDLEIEKDHLGTTLEQIHPLPSAYRHRTTRALRSEMQRR